MKPARTAEARRMYWKGKEMREARFAPMGPCRPRTDLAKLTKGQMVQEKLNGRWTRVALDRGMEPHKVKRDRKYQYLRFLNREFRVTI